MNEQTLTLADEVSDALLESAARAIEAGATPNLAPTPTLNLNFGWCPRA